MFCLDLETPVLVLKQKTLVGQIFSELNFLEPSIRTSPLFSFLFRGSHHPRPAAEDLILPHGQRRIYIGPLEDDSAVLGKDLEAQFAQFGTVVGVSRLRAAETKSK